MPAFRGRHSEIAGDEGIEPPTRDLEALVIPLHQSPLWLEIFIDSCALSDGKPVQRVTSFDRGIFYPQAFLASTVVEPYSFVREL